MLIFVATSKAIYGFLLGKEQYGLWQLKSPTALARQITSTLKEMGNFQQNREISLKDLKNVKWKLYARDLLDMILKGQQIKGYTPDFSKKFDELVIVPDGLLWYVPFEALQVKVKGELCPLISRVRIRYAPLASLATAPPLAAHTARGNTAVVVGRLYPHDDDSVAQTAFKQLSEVLPGVVGLKSPLPGPSPMYATLLNRLIVLDDLGAAAQAEPFGWAPLPLDRSRSGGALGEWIALPWGHPDQIILPGFHTAAEDAEIVEARGPPGNEIFLSVCGLMTSGARTILLSRWRTGGQSSFDLVREFTQELPHTTPADAWQRAVQVASDCALESGSRTAGEEGHGRGIAQGPASVFLGRLPVD